MLDEKDPFKQFLLGGVKIRYFDLKILERMRLHVGNRVHLLFTQNS